MKKTYNNCLIVFFIILIIGCNHEKYEPEIKTKTEIASIWKKANTENSIKSSVIGGSYRYKLGYTITEIKLLKNFKFKYHYGGCNGNSNSEGNWKILDDKIVLRSDTAKINDYLKMNISKKKKEYQNLEYSIYNGEDWEVSNTFTNLSVPKWVSLKDEIYIIEENRLRSINGQKVFNKINE
jgi:hypothetical protein